MRILSLNVGSSSVKYAVFDSLDGPSTGSGNVKGIGDLPAILRSAGNPAVIGHRIVHGGPRYIDHTPIDDDFVAELRRIRAWAPNHLDAQIAVIDACRKAFPGLPQIACLDTAFHRDMPEVARMLPLPRKYREKGIRRYGFHGISYEYLLGELERTAGDEQAKGRVIFAHLGNGASLAAVKGGRCVDTTMGFTPAAGLMMSTRAGDFDPGLAVYFAREEKMDADAFDRLINRESGLLGVSGTSADVRELLAAESSDPRAAEALALFCHCARKLIGAMAASMGGVETLVFSGGIGENVASIRSRICEGLKHLGPPDIRVIRTDEERQIARIASRLISARVPAAPPPTGRS